MRERRLQAHRKPKWRTTTDSSHAFPRYPNLVEQLEVVRPEQVWVSDITSIGLREEFVYLAVLMDVFTRSIRGWDRVSITASPCERWSGPWLIPRQKFTTPIKVCSMPLPPIPHACKRLGHRSVWQNG